MTGNRETKNGEEKLDYYERKNHHNKVKSSSL